MKFLESFKKRKIVQWALAYLAGAWLIIQLVDVLGGRWGVTENIARLVDLVLLLGFLVALVIAWYHGEKGRQHVSGMELLIIAVLLGAGGLGLSFVDLSSPSMATAAEGNQYRAPSIDVPRGVDAAPWVAVMPFRHTGDDGAVRDLADGLTSSITAGLSRFSHLIVLSQGTVGEAARPSDDARSLGQALGARYVMEGDLRRAGNRLRMTVSLTDARDGTTAWSESFERDLADDNLFDVQDALTDRIVATVADVNGVLTRTVSAGLEDKAPEELTPYEAILQWSHARRRAGIEDQVRSKIALERAIEGEPNFADAHACLAHVYAQDYINAYNQLDNPMDLALAAARRAVALDPTNSLTQYALAFVTYFRRDVDAFIPAAERAIALNPRDTQTMAMLGILIGYAGDWDRGVELTTRAMALNPNHPGWYRFNTFFNEYRQGNYAEALDIALRVNMPAYWGDPLARALAYGQLGREAEARQAATDLLALWPSFERDYYEQGLENWIFPQPDLMRHIMDGLRKAGLDMTGPA